MNMIGKGQIRWLPKGEVVGQKRFIERIVWDGGLISSASSHHTHSSPRFATCATLPCALLWYYDSVAVVDVRRADRLGESKLQGLRMVSRGIREKEDRKMNQRLQPLWLWR